MKETLRQNNLPAQRTTIEKMKAAMPILTIFALLHIITYFFVGTLFLLLVQHIPDANRIALDYYQPYQPITGITVLTQLIRGLILGVVYLPLLKTIMRDRRSFLLLAALIWGVGLFASVEPLPGSFEGMLYTITTPLEHAVALTAVLIQTLCFTGLFIKWASSDNSFQAPGKSESVSGQKFKQHSVMKPSRFIRRFTLFHVFTYFIVGALFYRYSIYQEAIETMEMFELWRPLEESALPIFIFFGQFFRGMVMATLLLPFSGLFLKETLGWLKLFITMWGMTFLSAFSIAPWIIQDILTGNAPLVELLVGPPEVTIQMFLFSAGLAAWYGLNSRTDMIKFKIKQKIRITA